MTRRSRLRAVQVRPYTWNAKQPDAKPGVLMRDRAGQITHLTPAEAVALADRLVDIAEQMLTDQQEIKTMTTPTDLPSFLIGPDFGARVGDLEALAVPNDAEIMEEER